MSPTKRERTVLIVDIESGSVGAALARLVPGEPPKLFAEARVALPIFTTLSSATLVREIEKTLRELLLHASLVATRLRGHTHVSDMGVVSSALVFLSPPWTSLTQHQKGLQWEHEPSLVGEVRRAVEEVFGAVPTTFHAFGIAANHAANTLFQTQHTSLLCTMGGEVGELLLVDSGAIAGHATIPLGQHMVLRTLQHHAGLSAQEARSALHLPAAHNEPLNVAAVHLAREFAAAAHELVGARSVRGILVIAPEPAGEWFAQALACSPGSADSLVELFPQGTTVRALHTHHLIPHLSAHAAVPDLLLMLEALFAGKVY